MLFSTFGFGQSISINPDSLQVKNATNAHIAGVFTNLNASNPDAALKGITYGTGIAVDGLHYGTHGKAAGFWIHNPANTSETINASTKGAGRAAFFGIHNVGNSANATETETNGTGHAFQAYNRGNGPGGNFTITKSTNNNIALYSYTNGTGNAIAAYVNNSASAAPASWNGTSGSGPAVFGINSGTGRAAYFQISNAASNEAAVIATNAGAGAAITGVTSVSGQGIFGFGDPTSTGIGVQGYHTGTGIAGYFQIARSTGLSPHNIQPALVVESNGYGANTMLVNYTGPASNVNLGLWQKSGVNKIRFSDTGNGYFAGTVNPGGADLAEAFETERSVANYEMGDVMVISLNEDRKVEKSNKAYSSLVAGVYATKPGVLLREQSGLLETEKEIPLGVIGVIPTKVCSEGGKIQRGDLLVSSSKAGYAMKAKVRKIKPGQVLGKALENFDGKEGMIKVLIGVK